MNIHHRKGFTLIEVLVVVLITGILAAVALPQYQKAVKKTRLTNWITTTHTLSQSIDIYLLEHDWPSQPTYFTGDDTSSVNHFSSDIDLPWIKSSSDHMNSYNDTGSWQAVCFNDRCEICVNTSSGTNTKWLGSKTVCVKKWPNSYNSHWVLSAITGDADENTKLICQYWATHYGADRMTNSRKTACASLGVE